ncbi:hypothetical protein [Goodfellowiella coeruleoviolacea]|uniref:Uncharacterized protein n=1 Tax=Goodfellowiella coeruleoviolacea TaxID=334858 RepID=A0AAE3GGS2_9PSEU|nr:hypothetical protein [Goodfellowiella coeruleoviolacea]MCP2167860.1 hypothetical protein [Goodfellowiella coeruleoviolacea]
MTVPHDPRVRAALDRALELGEIGIAVAAYHRGELIVDAVAGLAGHLQAERGLRPAVRAIREIVAEREESP